MRDKYQQTLYDFDATIAAHPEYDEATLMNKFPEFGGSPDRLRAAFDYSATLRSGKYGDDITMLNSKFPEFFGKTDSVEVDQAQKQSAAEIVLQPDTTSLDTVAAKTEQLLPKPNDIEQKAEVRLNAAQQQKGFWRTGIGDAIEKFGAGVLNTLGGLGKIDEKVSESTIGKILMPGNIVKDAIRKSPAGRNQITPDDIMEAGQRLSEKGDRYGLIEDKETGEIRKKQYSDLWKEGKYIGAAGEIMLSATESAPTSLLAMVPGAGLALVSASAAGQKYNELDTNPDTADMPEWKKWLNATVSGVLEGATEKLGEKVDKAMIEPFLKKMTEGTVKKILKKGGVNALIQTVTEGAEETLSQIGENVVDYATGVNSTYSPFEGVRDAFVYGAGGGAQFGGVTFSMSGYRAAQLKSDQKRVGKAIESIKSKTIDHIVNPVLHPDVDIRNSAFPASSKVDMLQAKQAMDKSLEGHEFGFDHNVADMSAEDQKKVVLEMLDDETLNDEQKESIANFIRAANIERQMQQMQEAQYEDDTNAALMQVSDNTNEDTGTVVYAQLKNQDAGAEPLVIVKGLAINEDGQIDLENSSDIIYYKAEDGTTKTTTADNIVGIESMSVDDAIAISGESIRTQHESQRAEIDELVHEWFYQSKPAESELSLSELSTEELTQSIENIELSLESGVLNEEQRNELLSQREAMAAEITLRQNGAQESIEVGLSEPVEAPGQIEVEATPEQRKEQEKEEFMSTLPIFDTGQKAGQIDQSRMTTDQTIQYFEYQFGEERALSAAKQQIEAIKKQHDRESKKLENDPMNIELNEKVDAIQAKINEYEAYVKSKHKAQTEVRIAENALASSEEAERKAIQAKEKAQEAVRAQLEEEAVKGVPDISVDKAADARNRGFRVQSGVKIDRQPILTIEKHKETERKFSTRDKDVVPVKRTIVDARSLQPSHKNGARNANYFIPETQPKERTDKASIEAKDRIAGNINPVEITSGTTAYTGAPIANQHGEIIQGNGRTNALQTMYESHHDQAAKYKQHLAETAHEYGMTADEVMAMERPVAIDIATVEDSEAIRLGQLNAADTESGGKQRIQPQQAAVGLGDRIGSFVSNLFHSTNDEASISEVMDQTGKRALDYLHQLGLINNTQYESSFDDRGNITPEAKKDLQDIAAFILFNGANDNIKQMFASLPDKARKSILQTIHRDADSHSDNQIVHEIRSAIEAYNLLMQHPEFASSNKYADLRIIAEQAKSQTQMFNSETKLPLQKYSNFAIELAIMFKSDTQKGLRDRFNSLYNDLQGKGGDMFNEAVMLPLSEAIKKNFNNIDYVSNREQIQRTHVGASSRGGEQGQSKRAGSPEIRKQDKTGKRTPDSGARVADVVRPSSQAEGRLDPQTHQAYTDESNRLSKQFNTPVHIHTSTDTIASVAAKKAIDGGARIKGWYDIKTGEVHLYLPYADSIEDIRETFFHEAIGHKGVRDFLGAEKHNKLLNDIFDKLPKEVQDALLKRHGTKEVAADEFISEVAEKGEFMGMTKPTLLEKIVEAIKALFVGPDTISTMAAERLANQVLAEASQKMQANQTANTGSIVDIAKEVVKKHQNNNLGVHFRTAEQYEMQLDGIREEAIKDGTFMKAPNGKPTNLNERQWLQVRTPEFKKWFGDWLNNPDEASKVVDKNGEPMVVYHGTNKDFTIFDAKKGNPVNNGGHYFSNSKDLSQKFAGPNGKVLEVFLNIKNPNLDGFDGSGAIMNPSGYRDGGIYTKRNSDRYAEKGTKEYIVFNSNQIKSATDNVGTFDSENDDIRFRTEAWHGSPHHITDGFSTDKIGSGEGNQSFGWGLYFTDVKDIAQHYANKLSSKYAKELYDNAQELPAKTMDALYDVDYLGFDNEWQAINAFYKGSKSNILNRYDITEEQYDAINDSLLENRRHLYKVSLHDGKTPEQYSWLDWYESVPEAQLNKIKEQAKKEDIKDRWGRSVNDEGIYPQSIPFPDDIKGAEMYNQLRKEFDMTPQEASLFMLRAGVDGIRYPAESIARAGQEARGSNYVVFDENAVKVEEHVRFRATEQYEMQLDGIREKAIKDGSFMKAPNGKPTNLNGRQWLQVRTPQFKNWFGDWEKAHRIAKLRNSNAIEISVDEHIGKYDLNRFSAKRWIKNELRGAYVNIDTGSKIEITKIGTNKVTSHGERDSAHLRSIIAIPELIESSIFIEEQSNTKNNDRYDSYEYYVSGLKIGDVDYTAKIVVGVKGDQKYYDHMLTEIEKGKLLNNLNGIAKSVAKQEHTLSDIKDTKLTSILQENSSKVVDENGEPMVVYHGTDQYKFNQDKSKESGTAEFDMTFNAFRTDAEDGKIEKGAFFHKIKNDAYGQPFGFFLNIKNPIHTDNTTNNIDQSKYDGAFRTEVGLATEQNPEIVAFNSNQIKSATDNVGSFDSENEDTRFRISGEIGAANMDKAEGVTTRIDNLSVAKEMTNANKDAKTIKLATGWELGKDGMWRYETEDIEIDRDIKKIPLKELEFKDKLYLYKEAKLSDIVNNNNVVFKAYPEIKDTKVVLYDFQHPRGNLGSYRDGAITLWGIDFNGEMSDRQLSTLIHELQHAIQGIEGFAAGGSQEMFNTTNLPINPKWNEYNTPENKANLKRYLDLYNSPEYQAELSSSNELFEKEYSPRIDKLMKEETIENSEEISEKIQDVFSEFKEFSKKNFPLITKLDKIAETTITVKPSEKLSKYEAYTNLAGEVEARNTQSRMRMTPEQRRNTLLSETEDVSREDQIVRFRKGESSVDVAAREVDANPTEEQKVAGNYKKGHTTVSGMNISIENPAGSVRSGIDQDGKGWEQTMHSHYGYFKNTKGKDGDHIDTFIKPGTNKDWTGTVYVVDQVDTTTKEFDESKVMLGYDTMEEAKQSYMDNYEDGWDGFMSITPVEVGAFKDWLYDGAKQGKAYSEYKAVKDAPKPKYDGETIAEYASKVHEYNESKNSVDDEARIRKTDEQLQSIRAKTIADGTFDSENDDIRYRKIDQEATPSPPVYDGVPIAEYASKMLEYYDNIKYRVIPPILPKPPILTSTMSFEEIATAMALFKKDTGEVFKDINKEMGKISEIYTEFVDRAAPLEKILQLMSEKGATLTDATNAYIDYMTSASKATRITQIYNKTRVEPLQKLLRGIIRSKKLEKLPKLNWNIVNEATGEMVNNKAITPYDRISLYLQAKDIVEASQLEDVADRGEKGFENNVHDENGKGVTASEYIEMFEKAVGKSAVNHIWKRVRAVNQFALDLQLEYGLITQEVYDEYTNGRKYYVPQRGWRERDLNDRDSFYVTDIAGTPDNPYNSALVKAKGRTSLAGDPLAYMQSIGESSIASALKNKTKQVFLEFAEQNSDFARVHDWFGFKRVYYVAIGVKDADGNMTYERTYEAPTDKQLEQDKGVYEKLKDIRDSMAISSKALADGVKTQKQHDATMKKLRSSENQLQNLIQVKHTDSEASRIHQVTAQQRKQHSVIVLKAGKEYEIIFSKNYDGERVSNVLNRNFGGSQADMDLMGMVKQNASKMTRTMSALMTQYNPDFAVKNAVRDWGTALISNVSEFGFGYTLSTQKNLFSPQTQSAVWQYVASDQFGKGEFFANTYHGQMLKDFFEDGSATGWSFLKDIDQLRTDMKRAIDPTLMDGVIHSQFGVSNAFGLKQIFGMLTELSELNTRFAQYLTSREAKNEDGTPRFTRQEAATHAKEVTVNFDRRGNNRFFSSLFSFFNAQIQGTNKMFRMVRNPKVRKALTTVFSAMLAGGVLQALLQPDPDDEDNRQFTEWEQMTNLCIGKVKIPLPQGFRAFWGVGTQIGLLAKRQKGVKESLIDGVNFFFGELIPEQFTWWMNGFEIDERTGNLSYNATLAVRGAMPTSVQPAYDVLYNTNFMGGTSYRTEFTNSLQDTESERTLGKRNVSAGAQWMSDQLFKMGGGDVKDGSRLKKDQVSVVQGMWDINPSALETLFSGYGGGTGKFVVDMVTLSNQIMDPDKKVDVSGMQIFNSFYKQPKEYTPLDNEMRILQKKTNFYKNQYSRMKKDNPDGYRDLINMHTGENGKMRRRNPDAWERKLDEEGTPGNKMYDLMMESEILLKQLEAGNVDKRQIREQLEWMNKRYKELQ